jgi:hypothetical protein
MITTPPVSGEPGQAPEHVVSRGRATVIHAQAGKARDLRAQGWSMHRVADHYGCSVTTVWRVLRQPCDKPCADH